MFVLANKLQEMVFGNPSSSTDEPYNPSPLDICKLRALLARERGLPPDIVDVIFDYAEYWAHSSNHIDYLEEHKDALRVAGGGRMENRFLVSSKCPSRLHIRIYELD
jgi:hypothetical protein